MPIEFSVIIVVIISESKMIAVLKENKQSYISELYIIISGRFTSNAKEKIWYKISKSIYGAVHFLDKEDTENLTVKYWRA